MSVMTDTRLRSDIHIGCDRHPFDAAAAACERCRSPHCSECLVFPFGPRRAICIPCALVAGGIRRH